MCGTLASCAQLLLNFIAIWLDLGVLGFWWVLSGAFSKKGGSKHFAAGEVATIEIPLAFSDSNILGANPIPLSKVDYLISANPISSALPSVRPLLIHTGAAIHSPHPLFETAPLNRTNQQKNHIER